VIKLKKVVSLGKFDVLMELAVATQPTAGKTKKSSFFGQV
jgi:hypothetical protein